MLFRSPEALPDGTPEPSYAGAITHGTKIRRRSRRLAPKMSLSIVIYPNDELPFIEIVTSPEIRLPLPRRRIRLEPKSDLSIAVHADSALASIEVTTSPEIAQAPAVSRRADASPSTPSKYLNGEVELDIGMASYATWNGGKKARCVCCASSYRSLLMRFLKSVRRPPHDQYFAFSVASVSTGSSLYGSTGCTQPTCSKSFHPFAIP